MPRYRVILTTGEVFVTEAANAAAARTEAFINCPAMKLFSVHIDRVERLKSPNPSDADVRAYIDFLRRTDDSE